MRAARHKHTILGVGNDAKPRTLEGALKMLNERMLKTGLAGPAVSAPRVALYPRSRVARIPHR